MREPGQGDETIGLHWDKDEDLVDNQGLNVHPHISTVTYLSDWGSPTLILEKKTPVQYLNDSTEMHGPIRQVCVFKSRIVRMGKPGVQTAI